MPRSVSLAVELARLGAPFVVVGSAARLLLGDTTAVPRDLDVVVEDADVDALVSALHLLGVEATAAQLRRCRDLRVPTGWGPLDVFVGAPRGGTAYPGSALRAGAA